MFNSYVKLPEGAPQFLVISSDTSARYPLQPKASSKKSSVRSQI